jgi:hypothetical protein
MATSHAFSLAVTHKPTLYALEQIRRMRGGAQSHLMRCSDGNYYVVKFPNNPQSPVVLANELLGGRLAELLGLPVALGTVVYVSEDLIRLTPELVMEMPRERAPCQPGPCFASLYQGNVRCHSNENCLSDTSLEYLANVRDFCGMLVFDKWTCNLDGRQIIFLPIPKKACYRGVMIDQGFCFGDYAWKFSDSPRRGLYGRLVVYLDVRSIKAFEPWLERVEHISLQDLRAAAEGLPEHWYGPDRNLGDLLGRLHARRISVRELILSARHAASNPFPNWLDGTLSRQDRIRQRWVDYTDAEQEKTLQILKTRRPHFESEKAEL